MTEFRERPAATKFEMASVPLVVAALVTCFLGTWFSLPVAMGNVAGKKLYVELLKNPRRNYNKAIRPVQHENDTVIVKIGLRLSQVVDLVSCGVKGWVRQGWVGMRGQSVCESLCMCQGSGCVGVIGVVWVRVCGGGVRVCVGQDGWVCGSGWVGQRRVCWEGCVRGQGGWVCGSLSQCVCVCVCVCGTIETIYVHNKFRGPCGRRSVRALYERLLNNVHAKSGVRTFHRSPSPSMSRDVFMTNFAVNTWSSTSVPRSNFASKPTKPVNPSSICSRSRNLRFWSSSSCSRRGSRRRQVGLVQSEDRVRF